MDVKVEFSLYVMGAEFAKTIDRSTVNTRVNAEGTAFQLTGLRPR